MFATWPWKKMTFAQTRFICQLTFAPLYFCELSDAHFISQVQYFWQHSLKGTEFNINPEFWLLIKLFFLSRQINQRGFFVKSKLFNRQSFLEPYKLWIIFLSSKLTLLNFRVFDSSSLTSTLFCFGSLSLLSSIAVSGVYRHSFQLPRSLYLYFCARAA